ncbi:AfsR/SARP family transcriptional regulator [Kribbella albertanoniae]|nr:BTAD domain-containing putative transcriptional regulator [Kribbella albertanoniae]
MRFQLLGPVEAWIGDEQVPLGGAKPRALLAALLLDAGHVVPIERLARAVWDEDPPASSRALVQTYISGLRRGLRTPAGADLIAFHPGGYAIQVPAGALDSAEFERLAGLGRLAADDLRYDEAVDAFCAALGLWRGPAFGGIGESFLRSEAAQLEELRLSVTEQRISSELALGRHEQLVGELTSLVGHHPTRERLRRDLMLAMYRLGRQADALAVYRDGRAVLVDDLGIEPGQELQSVHDAILRSDDSLLLLPPLASREPVADQRSDEQPRRTVPSQLPAAPADFTGREKEAAALADALSAGASMPIAVVSGPGGSGKSALAIHVTHRTMERYPDGQFYVELRGTSETPAEPWEVLGRILRQLGVVPAESLEERVADYRSLLAGQRVLVVLDDARDEQQVRHLVPGSAGCGLLITSRNRLVALAGASLTELDVLTTEEALELLAKIAGQDRVAAEPEAAMSIVEKCDRMPLALRIAGARLASRRAWTVALLADRLDDEHRRLDELAIGDHAVRATIELGYGQLGVQSKRVLRLLGLLGLSSFPAWLAGVMIQVSTQTGEQLLEGLVDAQLLQTEQSDALGLMRYRLHDLVRLYARERAESDESPETREQAINAVLSRWIWLLREITSAAPSGAVHLRVEYSLAAPADPSVTRPVLADPNAWFDVEQDSLVRGVELASALDLDEIAVQLASALCDSFFVSDNRFDAWSRSHTAALTVARRLGNVYGEAVLLAESGQLSYEQDNFAQAREYFSQSLSMFRIANDRRGEAASLTGLGMACREQGYLPESLHFLNGAERLWTELADDGAVAHVNRVSGSVHLEKGDYQAAWQQLADALWFYRKINSVRGEGMTLRTMALYHRARGELDRADETGAQALAIFETIGDRLMTAYALQTQGKTWLRMGRHREARRPLEEALRSCEVLADRFGVAFTLRALGELDLAEGALQDARARLAEAIALYETLDLPLWRARTLRDLAAVREGLGDADRAKELRSEALEVFGTYGAREHEELSATGL